MKQLTYAVVVLSLAGVVRADDWPQWLGPKRDGVWRETGLMERFPPNGPKVLWRAPVDGGYAGPAVADGRVYVTDYVATGDRTPMPDQRNKLAGKERVLCFDAGTGKPVWKHEYACAYDVSYPAGPRCTPTVEGGKVYTLGTMGHLFCLDAASGAKVWERDLVKDYRVKTTQWGFSAHPLVDGNKLICVVGGDGSTAVAFDKNTGRELWKAVEAGEPGYCPPSIIEAAGKRQLLIWDSEKINSLDPQTGKVYWTVDLKPNYGMAIAAPRKEGDYLFASAIHNVAAVYKLKQDKPGAEVVWTGDPKNALYAVNATPFVENGIIYGCDATGAFRAVDLRSGTRLWETYAPTTGGKRLNNGTAFLVKNGDRFVLFNELGELILAKLDRAGYHEISRAKVLEPTGASWGRNVLWSHPAFANRCVFARNDKELICVSLAADSARR